jgi:hypothetical protein
LVKGDSREDNESMLPQFPISWLAALHPNLIVFLPLWSTSIKILDCKKTSLVKTIQKRTLAQRLFI